VLNVKVLKPIRHIFWFAHYNLSCPSARYRGKYALDFISSTSNIGHSFVTPGYSPANIIKFIIVYFKALCFCGKNSLIVIQKVHTNNIYANALKFLVLLRKKYTVFDIDDAEYIRHSDKTLKFFLKNCCFITVGSQLLLEYASRFNPNVILNTSPVISHDSIKSATNKKLTIGWVGDFGNGNKSFNLFAHKRSLFELFFPAIKTIAIPVKLVLLGITNKADNEEIRAYFSENENLELEIPEKINWQDEDWVYNKIKKFDIGISPMVDHEFNLAKSAFKVKQYFSCGVPVLGCSIGENPRFIRDGQNGFFCDSPEDFKDKILEFSSMSKTRYLTFSSNALKTKELFSMNAYCENLIFLKYKNTFQMDNAQQFYG